MFEVSPKGERQKDGLFVVPEEAVFPGRSWKYAFPHEEITSSGVAGEHRSKWRNRLRSTNTVALFNQFNLIPQISMAWMAWYKEIRFVLSSCSSCSLFCSSISCRLKAALQRCRVKYSRRVSELAYNPRQERAHVGGTKKNDFKTS